MTKQLFWIILYGWALTYHGLLWVHIYHEGSRTSLAIVTMALGLLVIWGVLLGLVQKKFMQSRSLVVVSSPRFVIYMMLLMTGLACMAEVVSVTMTNTAYLWSLSPYEAYITASPNYIEVVTRHSVIVFLPQFLAITLLHHRYQYKGFAWFVMYGLIGYVNEWLAFGEAASWVSIPFWMIIYGWIVYLPTHWLRPDKARIKVRIYHYGAALFVPLAFSIPWALFLVAWLHS
ncbi:MAG: hypothetical protein EA374_08520 [Acholeplasmatales bacterium]|nr:MAG: hypothetical protein EA374_08520 [Acholeplasmatales bacterium]